MEAQVSAGSAGRANPGTDTGRIRRLLIYLLVALFAASSWSVVSADAAGAELARSGRVDRSTGFPGWLEDTNGLRLEPCFAGPYCSRPAPDADHPPSTPGNIGKRVIYWSAAATMPTNHGGHASLTLSTQGDFLPTDEPNKGTQHAFSRIRITADNLVPGATYRVTHPYGTETFTAADGGSRGIDYTEDVGCLKAPCGDFEATLNGRVGPWIIWSTLGASEGAPPTGYVGDAATAHEVVGSPVTDARGKEQNYFEIKGPNVGGRGVDRVRTDRFVVEGKVARLTVFADPRGALHEGDLTVQLAASDPAAKIFYTTDGTKPTPATARRYRKPVPVAANKTKTTLKFMAIGQAGSDRRRSPVFTETYYVGGV